MKKMSKKYLIGIIIGLVLIIGITLTFVIKASYADPLENDTEVEPNTDLTYYLKVKYDGVDKEGVESDDNTLANINSSYITVTDKIPEGLTFKDFVTTSDGSIGAVKRSDGTTVCAGNVVDDTNEASPTQGEWNQGNTEYTYHGLHYNAGTRTVTFKVKDLKAGCELTVGIITTTPATIDDPNTQEVETRRDFYNFAEAVEGPLSVPSNTVHAFMGDSATMHNVTYSYTGTVPSGAPSVPSTTSYAEGAKVGVAASPTLEGYTFSGWTTNDATISNGSFTMPNTNVTITGSFTEKTKHTVTYSISGTTPEGYVLPTTKSYSAGEIVEVDSLKSGDIINGYKFLGWTSSVTITDGEFEMPNSNVTITGSFEAVTYKVTYRFHPGVLPPNSDSLLPSDQSYTPGASVTLAADPSASGYKFLGWYHENNFTMPEENVVIYGEWMTQTGTFRPTITKEIVSAKNNYKSGDEIEFKITVTNTASYQIKEVLVKEEGGVFEARSGYTLETDHMAKISSIPASGHVDLYAKYTVKNDDVGTKKNSALIKGALADNNYTLEEREYKAEVNYSVGATITITNNVRGNMASLNEYFKFKVEIGGATGDTYTISGQDSSVTYNGQSVTPSTTYTVGEDNYIYLKHGQNVTIGGDANDDSIPGGVDYSVIEQGAESYDTYINGSSTNNKTTGTLRTNTNSPENTVAFINEKNVVVPTGKIFKNSITYIIGAIIIIGVLAFMIIRKKLNKS